VGDQHPDEDPKEGYMSFRVTRLILLVSAFAMATSVWAAREDTASVSFRHTTSVAGKAIQPGNYEIKAIPNNTSIQILRSSDNKLIATVEGTWVALNSKPRDTEVLSNKGYVEEIDFGGKTEAIRFTQN
jgi:hypothetical protein